MRLMTVWRITEKTIRAAISLTYAQLLWQVLTMLVLRCFCVFVLGFSVKVKLSVVLLYESSSI